MSSEALSTDLGGSQILGPGAVSLRGGDPRPSGSPDGERWFVATTLPRKEKFALAQLSNQNIRSFLPLHSRIRRHARKTDTVVCPVFPGYIFILMNTERQRWHCVNNTLGIGHLIMNGDRPQPVRRGIVETLMQSADPTGILVFNQVLKPGDNVRLASGVFADYLGILQRLDSTRRVQVLLNIVGGMAKVSLSQNDVRQIQ